MKRKYFKVPLDLEQYNFNKVVLCQDTDQKESALTECQEVESDSNQLLLWPVSLLSTLKR